MEFKVELDVFSGPLDLLLYLVKKHEVDVAAVPLATVAAEFVAHIDVLEALALDEVGEFVELASVLLEIKARALVPRPEEIEEPIDLPREDLVRRLLEYTSDVVVDERRDGHRAAAGAYRRRPRLGSRRRDVAGPRPA